MKTHEELAAEAFRAYENSSINYNISDAEMAKKLFNSSDAVLYGFINFCLANS